MKKYGMIMALVLACVSALGGCGSRGKHTVKIVVPAGSQEAFVYSDEEISPNKDSVTILSGEGVGDTMVVLMPVGTAEGDYRPTYLTHGMPVKMEAEPGMWFRVGVSVQNPTEEDMVVYVDVMDAEIRIE